MGEQETSRTGEDQEQPQGADSPESKGQERDFDQEVEDAKEEVKQLEEDPPEKLEDWPSGRAKYETFGGPEHETSYEEAATSKLGPAEVRHREDGSVEVGGEEVDDPEEYKGDPIPGGPTDPAANDSRAYGEPDLTDETSQDLEDGDGKGR